MDIILQTFSNIDPGIIPESLVSAFIASILYFAAKKRGKGKEVTFDPSRTVTTLGVAFVVSLGLAVAPGQTLDQASLATKMATLGPLTVFVEKWVRQLFDTDTSDSGNPDSGSDTDSTSGNSNEPADTGESDRFAGRRE